MKKLIVMTIFVLSAGAIVSCKKDDDKKGSAPPTTTTPTPGTGRAVLHYGTDSLVIQGAAGATDDLGNMIIAIQDATVSSHAFSIALNVNDLPNSTTTYNLTTSAATGANEALMEFSWIGSSILDWSSDSNSGTVTLTVSGNQVSCTFNNVPLQPSAFYNTGAYDQVGYATGTLTFTK
jgi:hypothetical protein